MSKDKKKGSDVRRIFKTTDGYFTDNSKINKVRRVAVIEQRKDDGALAVCKIYSKKNKDGSRFVSKLVLKPEKHSSLTEESIVGSQLIVGKKSKDGKYKAIFKGDLVSTNDELTKKEHRVVKKGLGGDVAQHKKTENRKMRAWKNHFKGK